MANIGFIGLGHMGKPMAQNLVNKGHNVVVFDVCQGPIDKLVALGAKPAASVKAMAPKVDFIFTMLQAGEQVREVYLGEQGVFHNLNEHTLCIDCSSIDVATTRQLHEVAKREGILLLDAPVSGGVAGANAGTLTFMVGGDEQIFHQAEPILACLGKKIIYAGAGGSGQVAKICNNMILGISMIAVSEGFVLAKQLGLDATKFFEIANSASGQCWAMSQYCPMPGILENVPSSNNFIPGFAAEMMLKDLRLSQEAALETKTSTPLGAQATALYSLFVNEGNALTDFSGIINMITGNKKLI